MTGEAAKRQGQISRANNYSGETPLAMTTSTSKIYCIAMSPTKLKGYHIKVTEVDPNSARPGAQIVLASEYEVQSEDSVLYIGSQTTAPIIAWADKSLKTLKLNILGKKDITAIDVATRGQEPLESISIHAPTSGNALSHFLVHYQSKDAHWAEVYHIEPVKRSISKAYDLPKLGGLGAFSVSTVDANVYFTRHSESESVLISAESHGIIERWPVKGQSSSGQDRAEGVIHAVSEVVARTPSKFAVRSALTLASGDVVLTRNGELLWTRSESLSGVVAAAWVEIPKPENLAKVLELESHRNVLAAYVHRVTRHIEDLQYLPRWLQSIPFRVLSSFGLGVASAVQPLNADPFGFRKLIIVATEKGRVIALDSGSRGQILWSVQAVELAHGKKWKVVDIHIQDGAVWIFSTDRELSAVVSLAGELNSQYQFDGPDKSHHLIPVSSKVKSSLLALSPDGTPELLPADLEGPIYVVTRTGENSLSGWSLVANQKPSRAWSFVAPEGYGISAVKSRPESDPVASRGRALGDRNVLYKFLSPNLVLVVCLNPTSSSAKVFLLDSINGQVLYTTEHTAIDASAKVSATFSENWFIYSLSSDPALAESDYASFTPKSMLLTIAELFESPIPNDRGPLGSSNNVSSLQGSTYPPYVSTQTYTLPTGLLHLSTTSTKQGITPRSILAYSPSLAALFAIPVSILSPRRPVGRDPTAVEREEGLFRYAPFLDFDPRATLSHKRELLGIKGIISTPSDMESTSLVFSYGDLDIFGTRVSPIGTFDVLGKGFGKLQLILTVVALAAGTGILAPMVRSDEAPLVIQWSMMLTICV